MRDKRCKSPDPLLILLIAVVVSTQHAVKKILL